MIPFCVIDDGYGTLAGPISEGDSQMQVAIIILAFLANVLLVGNVYYLQVIACELKAWRSANGGG